MQAPLNDLLRGGIPALVALVTTEQLRKLVLESRIVPYPIGGAVVRQGDAASSEYEDPGMDGPASC